jgi:hypothetical protein
MRGRDLDFFFFLRNQRGAICPPELQISSKIRNTRSDTRVGIMSCDILDMNCKTWRQTCTSHVI